MPGGNVDEASIYEIGSIMKALKIEFFAFAALFFVSGCTNNPMIKKSPDPAYRLDLAAPINKWDEAIPLGNGLTGGLLWGEGNEIRLSLDRGDIWDLRPHPGFAVPGFSYETVCRMAQSGQTKALNKKYARASDYPTKLPGCRLVLTLPDRLKARSFHLNMKTGVGSVTLGQNHLECFFSAVKPYALVKIPGSLKDMHLVSNQAVTKLGNQPAQIEQNGNSTWLVQKALTGLRYAFYVEKKQFKDYTLLAITSATNKDNTDPLVEARRLAQHALSSGYDKLLAEHERWWAGFWGKSSVVIPDSAIQQQYNLVQYFYGAASRDGDPPIPLQGVWTADTGTLPPWHGDYHNDLNTQLTYWAYLTSNHLIQGRGFLDFMWSLKPVHEQFARKFYGTPGMVVPGVMALDGRPMGVWYQYSLSPTMGAWIAQAFYLHWRYDMDKIFLKERAYPYCAEIADAIVGLMKPDKNGKLKLPLSSSPEIHNNTQQAWLKPNSNFDLSLIRWLFGANAEMAKDLGMTTEAKRWKNLLSQMDDLAVAGADGELLLAPGEPLEESHRHFSHLMSIYPLGTINIDGGERDRKIIEASMAQIDTLGSENWCGYSYSWMACMRARIGQGDRALEYLHDYMDCISRNGFHLNGRQKKKDLPGLKMHAFTLEGNFAAAQAVHEMLLQSWGGRIRIFPAIPSGWKNTSFHQWRAEGGFLVDAERVSGQTIRVSVTATVDQLLHLKNPFGRREYMSNATIEEDDSGMLTCRMEKGQRLVLSLKEK